MAISCVLSCADDWAREVIVCGGRVAGSRALDDTGAFARLATNCSRGCTRKAERADQILHDVREHHGPAVDAAENRWDHLRIIHDKDAGEPANDENFAAPLYRALRLKTTATDASISERMDSAVRHSLAEDTDDLAAFDKRAKELDSEPPAIATSLETRCGPSSAHPLPRGSSRST